MSNLFPDEKSGAIFSTCRQFRFALWRIWDEGKPLVMFIGLNPSKANESEPDNTIKRVKAIAEYNGYGGFYMMNCFPLVSTDPGLLYAFYETPFYDHEDIENMRHLLDVRKKCKDVVFAWGNFKEAKERAKSLTGYFKNAWALEILKDGSPKHPLYCKKETKLIPFIRSSASELNVQTS
jgi:hypothetical protein